MVTSGATPLEGLIGDTSCGDIDPGILITLNKELKWGYEMINKLLTEESGLSGLAGKPFKMDEIFSENKQNYDEIRNIVMYKLLQTAGAAAAVMGSIDIIIFSGKYRRAAETIGPWLVEKLSFLRRKKGEPKLTWQILKKYVEEIISEDVEKILSHIKNIKSQI